MIGKIAAAIALLGLNFSAYYFLASNPVIPERDSFSLFPNQIGSWECGQRERMGEKIEALLGVTDYLFCNFTSSKQRANVGLYLGYHETQVRGDGGGSGVNAIHPPKHCIPGSGWNIIEHDKRLLEFDGLPTTPAEVNRLIVAKGDARQVVYYWYQSRGRVIADDWKKTVFLTLDRGLHRRTDGTLVRFTIPTRVSDEIDPDAVFDDIASQVVPLLPRFLPQ